MSVMLDGFITFDTSGEIPVIFVNFEAINNKIDVNVYKTTLVNVVTTAIYVSPSKKYNVIFHAQEIDNKANFFDDNFVSDLTKTFLTTEYMNSLCNMQIYDSPDWLKRRVSRLCDTLYRSMKTKVQFVNRV